MSHKITAFRTVMVAPSLANRFVVTFNVLSAYTMRIFDTTMPTKKVKYASYYDNGDEVRVPVRYETSGEWTFSVYEDDFASFSKVLRGLRNRIEPVIDSDGANANINAVREASGTSRYNRIRPKVTATPYTAEIIMLDSATGTIPVAAVQLRDVSIESVDPISLRASNSTEPLSIVVKCHYNDMKEIL